jgi:DNA-binding response OmpR family regulator
MKKIKTIVVLDDDHYFLALLKGYCCARNIGIEALEYNWKGISNAEKLKPDLIAVSLESVLGVKKQPETDLLKELSAQGNIKIIALNKHSTCYNTDGLLDWIDTVIENPYDINEIDAYLKKSNLIDNSDVTDFIDKQENRSGSERRRIKINNHGEIIYSDRRGNGDRRLCWLRRNNPELGSISDTSDQQFNIDQRNKCLFVKGQKIELTPKEFELLLFLSTDVDRVFTAEEIINHLWPESQRATKSDLYQYMHLLRKKIEPDPNSPQWIRNVKGFGYKLDMGSS